MAAKRKEHRELIKAAERAGGRVVKKTQGVMIHGPKGSAMVHLTTSDNRALKNVRSELRKAGLDI